jgi:hypothetical protein
MKNARIFKFSSRGNQREMKNAVKNGAKMEQK